MMISGRNLLVENAVNVRVINTFSDTIAERIDLTFHPARTSQRGHRVALKTVVEQRGNDPPNVLLQLRRRKLSVSFLFPLGLTYRDIY